MIQYFLLLVIATAQCTKHPVVFIPGIMSSILNATVNIPDDVPIIDRLTDCDRHKDWFTLWITLLDGLPYVNKCYISYLSCRYNKEKKLLENLQGVQIEPPQFGKTYAVDSVGPKFPMKRFTRVFHCLIETLEKEGYTDGFDLLGAPYDWRYYHLDSYFENVKKLIKYGFDNTGEKAVLVSHSMGGMTTYMLLDYLGKEFCDNYIFRWIALSTPFIGTTLANHVLITGYNMGYPVSKDLIKLAGRSFETLVMMAPMKGYWDENEVLVEMPSGKKYTVNDLASIYKTFDDMKDWVENALDNSFIPFLKKHNSKVPYGVEMHCGITSGVETPGKLIMKEESFEGDFTIEYVDGDEDVNIASLEYCKQMTEHFTNLGKYGHQDMLCKSVTEKYVKNLVCV